MNKCHVCYAPSPAGQRDHSRLESCIYACKVERERIEKELSKYNGDNHDAHKEAGISYDSNCHHCLYDYGIESTEELEKIRSLIDLERLAKLEHEQWAHWTRYMIDNYSPKNVEGWLRLIHLSYNQLSELEKESDRVWARKILKLEE